MKRSALAACLSAMLLVTGASASAAFANMTVQQFLTTAAGIPRNPTAMLRSDTRRLMAEVKGGFETIRTEQAAARQAGRTPVTCMPERASISPEALLARFNAIPASRRQTLSVTAALREWMAERYPCPR